MNADAISAEFAKIARCAECLGTLTLHSLNMSVIDSAGGPVAQRLYVDSIALAVHGFCEGLKQQATDASQALAEKSPGEGDPGPNRPQPEGSNLQSVDGAQR